MVALGPERFGVGSFLETHTTVARRLWSWELRFGTNFYRSRWTFDEAVYADYDYHWNRWGHELVAETFLEKWRTRPERIAPLRRAGD